jgi:hypothetical protein
MKSRLPILGLLVAIVALPCAAQTQENTNGANPADNSANTGSSQKTKTQNPPTPEKKKKKVWTNDEVGSLGGAISVVGDEHASDAQSQGSPAAVVPADKDPRTRKIQNYREQIRQLRAQIDAADKRISQLKNFKGENNAPTGGINPNQGYNMVPLDQQVKQLEESKKQLQGKIEDVENDARINGIDPGEIR